MKRTVTFLEPLVDTAGWRLYRAAGQAMPRSAVREMDAWEEMTVAERGAWEVAAAEAGVKP